MEHQIIVVGIGPGAPEYLPPAAANAIKNAAVLIGSGRALRDYAAHNQRTMEITGKLAAVLSFIKENLSVQDVTVMVSGDPGYYSLLGALRREFPVSRIRVIPGISAMQLAFSRLALPWQNASLFSLHGREPDPAALCYEEGRILGFLTDTLYDSHQIAGLLREHHWPPSTRLFICSRLSYHDEQIIETNLDEIHAVKRFSHCILVVVA